MGPTKRRSARVLPVSSRGEVLLLYGHDPAEPDAPYWFTIGGALEPGETAPAAAVRELCEETGIRLDEGDLVGPFHRGTHAFSFDGVDYLSDSVFFAATVDDVTVTFDGLEAGEVGTIRDARWWLPSDLTVGVPLSNPELPRIARLAVAAIC